MKKQSKIPEEIFVVYGVKGQGFSDEFLKIAGAKLEEKKNGKRKKWT